MFNKSPWPCNGRFQHFLLFLTVYRSFLFVNVSNVFFIKYLSSGPNILAYLESYKLVFEHLVLINYWRMVSLAHMVQ